MVNNSSSIQVERAEDHHGVIISHVENDKLCVVAVEKLPRAALNALNEALRPFWKERISRVRFTNGVISYIVYYVGPSDDDSICSFLDSTDLISICKVLLPLLKIESGKKLGVL